jgi:ABC-type Fe3+-hydroxamate transport system substrate-binding protein
MLLSACGEKREPTGARVPLYPVTVRDANRDMITLARAPIRIGVAGQAPAQIAEALAITVTSVGDNAGNLDLGLIRKLKPQLLIAGSEVSDAALDQARALKIGVYVVPDQTLDGIEKALTDISLLAGVPLRGRDAREHLARTRENVKAAIAGTTPVRVFFDLGHFATVSSSSFIGSILREAGGIDVAGIDPQEGPFPIERLRHLKPKVWVISSDSQVTLAALRRDRRIKWLPAIRSGRVVHANMSLLEPGPEAAAVLSGLARAFHPDAFR